MTKATLTSKGQITIPKSVRESLRLHPGDRIEFQVHDGKQATLKPLSRTVDEVFGKLHRPGQRTLSVEEMNGAVAERTRKRQS